MFLCLYKKSVKSLFVEYIDIKIFRISSLFLMVLVSLTKWLVGFSCGLFRFFRTKTVTFNTQLIQKVFQFLFFLLYVVGCYFYAQNLVSTLHKMRYLIMLIMAIFFKCPLYTYIEVKHKICYYGGFSKIPYINNKEEFSLIWNSRIAGSTKNWQKLTSTLDVKRKKL